MWTRRYATPWTTVNIVLHLNNIHRITDYIKAVFLNQKQPLTIECKPLIALLSTEGQGKYKVKIQIN